VPRETTVQELHNELAESQRADNEQKEGLSEIIRSLRADLHTQETSASAFIVALTRAFLTVLLLLIFIKPKNSDPPQGCRRAP